MAREWETSTPSSQYCNILLHCHLNILSPNLTTPFTLPYLGNQTNPLPCTCLGENLYQMKGMQQWGMKVNKKIQDAYTYHGGNKTTLQLPESYKVTVALTYSPAFLLISLHFPSLCYKNFIGCVALAWTVQIYLFWGYKADLVKQAHTHSNRTVFGNVVNVTCHLLPYL